MVTSMVTVQAGHAQAMAAEDFMGLAQCRAAPVTQRKCHLAAAKRLIANRPGGNYAVAPAFSFNLESHRAFRSKETPLHSRLSAPIAGLLYRVTPV